MNDKRRFQPPARQPAAGGGGIPLVAAAAHALATGADSRAVVLVEGVSDQVALEALAERRGRNLSAEEVSILPMGGATNIRSFLDLFGPQGLDVRLAGLCDAGEEGDFRRGLERAASAPTSVAPIWSGSAPIT